MPQEFEDIVPVSPLYLDTLKISETKKTKEEIDKTHKIENDIETEEFSESVDSDESIESFGESSGESIGISGGISDSFNSADKHEESDNNMHPGLSEDTAGNLDAEEKEGYNPGTNEYLEIEQPEKITGNEETEKIIVSKESVSFIDVEKSEDSEKHDSKSELEESIFFSRQEDESALFDSVVLLKNEEIIKLPENDKIDTHLIETTSEEKLALPEEEPDEEKPDVAETINTEGTELKPLAEIAQQPYSPEPEPLAATSQEFFAQDNKKNISHNAELPQDLSEIISSEKPKKRLFRRMLAMLLLILLLVAGIYFSGLFKIKPGLKESNKIKGPVVIRKPVPAQVRTPKPLIPRTSLSKPSDSVVYNVKKGDTLYKITERYTGDGWNYPKVARENEIPNPDLIFPEQKIKVPK